MSEFSIHVLEIQFHFGKGNIFWTGLKTTFHYWISLFWAMSKKFCYSRNEIGFYKTSIAKRFLHYLDTSIHFSVEPGNDFFNFDSPWIRNARFKYIRYFIIWPPQNRIRSTISCASTKKKLILFLSQNDIISYSFTGPWIKDFWIRYFI